MKARITDFLTPKEIELAIELKTADEIAEKIINPNIDRINTSLGQENDPKYLGYVCEYVLMQAMKRARR